MRPISGKSAGPGRLLLDELQEAVSWVVGDDGLELVFCVVCHPKNLTLPYRYPS